MRKRFTSTKNLSLACFNDQSYLTFEIYMNKILIIQKSENNKSISTKNFTLVLQIIFIWVNVDHKTHLLYCKTLFCF